MSSLCVKKVSIDKFKGIDSLELEFNEKMNVIIGVNGAGKTSILFALAMALSRFIGRIRSLNSNGIIFDKSFIKNDAPESSIKVEMSYTDHDIVWKIGKQRHQTKQTISNLEQINNIVVKINEKLNENKDQSVPVVVFYGVGRNVLDIPLRIKEKHTFEQLAAYDGALLNERKVNDFRLFFEWFRYREDIENEMLREEINDISAKLRSLDGVCITLDTQLSAVRRAIEELLPNITNIIVKRSPLRMQVTKQLSNKSIDLDISQLSDGEKCTLALAGDLARRLSIANPAIKNPLEGEGIVMIDEIDLHLHPQWECEIMPRLRKTFPNCQFIVTTHSPLVLSRLEPEEVFVLSYDENNKIYAKHPILAKGLSVNDILSGLMNEVKNRDNKAHTILSVIDNAIEDEDIVTAKKQLAKLKEYLNGKVLPEMKGQEASIAMFEAELNHND